MGTHYSNTYLSFYMQEPSTNRALIPNSQEEIFNQEMKERAREYTVVLHALSYSRKQFFCSTF